MRTTRLVAAIEEFHIPTADGGQIHALLLKSKEAKALVFYLHGNTGSLTRWQFDAQEICNLGYDVFVMDYRGYGRSRGKRSEALMHRDVIICFEFVQQWKPAAKTIIYGRSLGCAFAVRLAACAKANGLVLETPFYNLPRLAKHYHPYLPLPLLMRYAFRSDKYIQRVEMPILELHGTRDELIPYEHARDLYQTAVEAHRQIKMITIVNGRHSDLSAFPLFIKERNDFLSALTIE